MNGKVEKLQKLIDTHSRIVFFGGAGVSTESGIPDFRSVDGLYNQKYAWPPETILSHTFFLNHTKEFYDFYRDKMLVEAKPNPAHDKLAELENKGKLTAVVTQNIDGLHQAAGSRKVYELHGSVKRNACMSCGKSYEADIILESEGIPRCKVCGGVIKPDVVLYEEGLDQDTIEGAVRAISSADMLIVGGTSLVVYPAAGLVHYFHGDTVVLINKGQTGMEGSADLVITDPIGQVLSQIQV
ncbi:MAG: NAD-dependent protein deacylase [Eubacterium sp.]|nr:NAD-dependent protein deacylase [Eubacterium sp.]